MADTEQQQPMAEDSENSPRQQEQPPAEPDHVSKPPDHQRPTHQKCPRCESEHTKFCYYNNYSLNQPRYYCKTCKRYWTHGGALRNVPVGGSCRKRAKLSSPSSSSGDDYFMSQPSPPQLPHLSQNVNVPNNEYANLGMVDPIYAGVGGEYLSCLAAMQGLNYPFTDGNFGGIGNSNYGIIQGYNNVANFGSQEQMMQQQQQQPSEEVYKMGNESFEANGGLGNWTEGLINSSANVPGEFNPSGSGLDPNQWLDNVNGSGFRPDP